MLRWTKKVFSKYIFKICKRYSKNLTNIPQLRHTFSSFLFIIINGMKAASKEMKVELKNENQQCYFAGFGSNMLFEKGN